MNDAASVLVGAHQPRRPGRIRSLLHFLADPKATFSATLLTMFLLLAAFGPAVAPYGADEQNRRASLQPPSLQYPLGTDRLGRDVRSRVILGARISVRMAITAVAIAALVGIPVGLISGYAGGGVDNILMRIVDAWIAFPNIIFLLFMVAIIGGGVTNVMIAIGLNTFPIYARLVRAQTLSLREREFVLAARALGAGTDRILLRHILPNAIQPIIVQCSLGLGGAVLSEASLSFLGIGIAPPTPTWGVIISDGFQVIRQSPLISIAPGVAIVLFVLSVNLLGDRLRDILDPRLRGAR